MMIRLLCVAWCWLSCLPLLAQDTSDDLGAPGPEHQFLENLVGDWEVTVQFPVGSSQMARGKATCRGEWVLDGRFVRMEYHSTFAGKPLTVVRYIGFDRHRKQCIEIQFENTRTDVLQLTGEIDVAARTMTCRGKHIDHSTEKEVEVRSTASLREGSVVVDQVYVADDNTATTITLTHVSARPK